MHPHQKLICLFVSVALLTFFSFFCFNSPSHKQLITDERMAAHLNSLHISSNYTSHNPADGVACTLKAGQPATHPADPCTSSQSYAAIASHDLEQKLRNASRITLCEEIRKLAADPILPQAIFERFERPCTALVLWQPPQRIAELIVPKNVELRRKNDDAEMDNNNGMAVDLNNGHASDRDLNAEVMELDDV